jgi:3-hydroxybutyryl-CoA dehydrogenase
MNLMDELGPRYTPPEILKRKVANGELGHKSGQGFYAW